MTNNFIERMETAMASLKETGSVWELGDKPTAFGTKAQIDYWRSLYGECLNYWEVPNRIAEYFYTPSYHVDTPFNIEPTEPSQLLLTTILNKPRQLHDMELRLFLATKLWSK